MKLENWKITRTGHSYRVKGRAVIYRPEPWPGEPEPADITLSLRVKVKRLAALQSVADDSQDAVLDLLSQLFPAQAAQLDELDSEELAELFTVWSDAFAARQGVPLGEVSPSPDSSPPDCPIAA